MNYAMTVARSLKREFIENSWFAECNGDTVEIYEDQESPVGLLVIIHCESKAAAHHVRRALQP